MKKNNEHINYKKLTDKLKNQEGTALVEFLATLTFILMLILLILQTVIVFYNGILTTHALNLAAQEVAARGAVDANANDVLFKHLPGSEEGSFPRGQCKIILINPAGTCIKAWNANTNQPIQVRVGSTTLGTESGLPRGTPIKLTYTYEQSLGLLRIFGINRSFEVTREFIVVSQSLNE